MVKNIIIVFGLLALIALGYYLFVMDDQSLNFSNQQVNSQAQQETQAFLIRLNELKTINLNTEILNDPRFTNRVNYDTPVPILPVGRDNPFLPAN